MVGLGGFCSWFSALSGIGLCASDESAGKLTGEFSVRIGFYTGDKGMAVSLSAL